MKRSTPQLIAIGGFAGVGKSTLAKNLGNHLQIPVFEVDQIAKSIQQSATFTGSTQDAYGVAFDLFFDWAERHLKNGGSLIFDQNLGHKRTWQNLENFRSQLNGVAEVKIFILDCPFEVCLERFKKRTEHPNIDDVTLDDLADHKFKWDYLRDNDLPQAIRIDATQTSQNVFKEIMEYLA